MWELKKLILRLASDELNEDNCTYRTVDFIHQNFLWNFFFYYVNADYEEVETYEDEVEEVH